MVSRREFLGAIGLPTAAMLAGVSASFSARARTTSFVDDLRKHPGTPEEVAPDEDFWFEVGQAFTVDRSILNLNNGGVSPSPAVVQQAMKRHLDLGNAAPAYTLWRVLEPQRESVREQLAAEWGVGPDEIAITRNASEGLQTCQLGFDLRAGDEVLTSTQDYGRMVTTFQQREHREGIVLKQVKLPVPAEDPAEVVRLFEQAITPRTRMLLMSHVVNLTGQVLPVRDVVRMARGKGVPVVVDGAHSLAHFDFKLPDLECDYFATSLHKWLFAPHGTGLLYVRKEKIPGLWPLMAASKEMRADIRKFEEIGTHPAANALAIAEALAFHQGIGGKRKEARLVTLREYWTKPLVENDRVRLHTSRKRGLAFGIANIEIDGLEPGKLTDWLWSKHQILVTPIKHAEFQGVRVTPSVYTTLPELDRFVHVMRQVMRDGLPS